MAFSAEYIPGPARQRYFTFFATGGSAADTGSTMIEAFAPSFAFELDKIHLRLSAAHASVVDFMVYVSHHANSYFNHNLISQAMNAVRDHMWQADPNLYFHSGDCVHCSMIYSGANHYGLEISGWAITIPCGGW
jgi:hypothetical protein